MVTVKTQSFISITYLLIAAILGIVLRLFPVADFDVNYRFIVHTHSHIALLGWVYISLTTLLFHLFIKKEAKNKYTYVFWITQLTIIGMLLSFPFVGYALFSIIFSTLFLICTYWFYYFFKKNTSCNINTYSYKFINASLIFMVISSIGPWSLGVIMTTLGNTSHWYKNAIYFYLHFQYNGWFVLCLLGILIYFIERKLIKLSQNKLQQFYRLMIFGTIMTLGLSFLWIKPPGWLYYISATGAVLQCVALYKLFQILNKCKNTIEQNQQPFSYKALKFIVLLFTIKIVLQLISSIPYFAELIYKTVDFVIGYLHLVFLGIVSISVLLLLKHYRLLTYSKIWIRLFLSGFILSEFLIFYKGFCIWQQLPIIDNYHSYLLFVSALIPIGISGIFLQNIKPIFSNQLESL